MKRSFPLILGSLALIVATAPAATTAAGPMSVRQVEFPLPLLVRGDRPELGYDARALPAATGFLYVRNDLQSGYTRVPLTLRKAARRREQLEPNDNLKLLRAVVPSRLLGGHELVYYATVRDPKSGRSVNVPTAGAAGPRTVRVLDKPLLVALGTHRFGRTRPPDAVVARAKPSQVSFPTGEPCCGPSSFEIAPDRSAWLLDGGKQRLLVWRPGHPDALPRAVPLPIPSYDFALGPAGTLYVGGHCKRNCVLRLTASGKTAWQSELADSGFPLQLRVGPDGTLYRTGASESSGFPWRGRTWTPLATPAGRPLSVTQQVRRTLSGYQPLPGGLRLIAAFQPYHEFRYALVDRTGRVVRAWRVTSRTAISPVLGSTPGLVGGDPVVTFEANRGAGRNFKREYVVLRLSPGGTRARFALREAAWGETVTDVRVGPDGSLYQLSSAPATGVVITRFSLQG